MSGKTQRLHRKQYAKTIDKFAKSEIAHVLEKQLKTRNLIIIIEAGLLVAASIALTLVALL